MERIVAAAAVVAAAANCWAQSPTQTLQVTAMGSYYTHTSGNGSERDGTHASRDDLALGTCGCRLPDACDRHVHVTLAVLQSAADCPSGMRYCCSAQEIDQTLTANKPRKGYNGTERMLLERDAQENKLMEDSRNKVNNKAKWMEANTKYRNREKDYAREGRVYERHVQLVTPKDLSSPKKQNRETLNTVHTTSAMENVHKEMPNVSPDLVGSNDTRKNLKDDNYTLITKYKLATTESSAQPFITTDSGSLITATEGSTAAVKHTNESEEASIKTKEKSPASWPFPGPSKLSDTYGKSCFNIFANATCITNHNIDDIDNEIPAGYDYQTVELFPELNRPRGRVFDFMNFYSKGFLYSAFYWSYIFAFVYTACYPLSFFISENGIISIITKVLLIQFAPDIVSHPIFSVGDLFLSWLFNKII